MSTERFNWNDSLVISPGFSVASIAPVSRLVLCFWLEYCWLYLSLPRANGLFLERRGLLSLDVWRPCLSTDVCWSLGLEIFERRKLFFWPKSLCPSFALLKV